MRSILFAAAATILLAGFPLPGSADETDQTVGEFVATCSNVKSVPHQPYSDAYVNCTNLMMFAEMDPGYCVPPDSAGPDDVRVAVIGWLKPRPDMSAMKATAGILVALKALYCH